MTVDTAYLKDFRERINNNDYPGFLSIWEEYCHGDQPDGEEIVAILECIKGSELGRHFGLHVERITQSLWLDLKDPEHRHLVLQLVLDIQTSNNPDLADLATEHLKMRYPDDPLFSEKMRLIGLRGGDKFQSAIRNYGLLSHFKKGNFVYHTSGWGTGEVLDSSMVREEVTIEFENVVGPQNFSFEKAFKNLAVLPSDHFYARRFGNPDALEKEARENPSEVIRLLLRDLGPKTAAEIKEEFADLIIPTEDWNRFWQTARAKLKKDTKIESPKELKEPFRLRTKDQPHEIALHKALEAKPGVHSTIQLVYSFIRDFPEILKNQEFRTSLEARMRDILLQESLSVCQKLQILFFLEDLHVPKIGTEIDELITHMESFCDQVRGIDVMGFQKRALQKARKLRKDWKEAYLELLFTVDSNLIRDFIIGELDTPDTEKELKQKLSSLLIHPLSYPDIFAWYFQKIIAPKSTVPFSDDAGKNDFFEGLLILLDHLEKKPQHRDLTKKVLGLVTANRYKITREIMQHSSLEEVKEYLLLATKCNTLSDHDVKILYSFAEVVHPSISRLRKDTDESSWDENVLWATQEAYFRTQQKIQNLATTETVKNAEEIKVARAHGDLRENADFKAALERRERLQSELKFLTDQFSQARILTAADVTTDQVGKGTVVHCIDSKGEHVRYSLIGPWDADPEKRILSLQSKLAQLMTGLTIGEKFEFQGDMFTITDIDNYFDQKL